MVDPVPARYMQLLWTRWSIMLLHCIALCQVKARLGQSTLQHVAGYFVPIVGGTGIHVSIGRKRLSFSITNRHTSCSYVDSCLCHCCHGVTDTYIGSYCRCHCCHGAPLPFSFSCYMYPRVPDTLHVGPSQGHG